MVFLSRPQDSRVYCEESLLAECLSPENVIWRTKSSTGSRAGLHVPLVEHRAQKHPLLERVLSLIFVVYIILVLVYWICFVLTTG